MQSGMSSVVSRVKRSDTESTPISNWIPNFGSWSLGIAAPNPNPPSCQCSNATATIMLWRKVAVEAASAIHFARRPGNTHTAATPTSGTRSSAPSHSHIISPVLRASR